VRIAIAGLAHETNTFSTLPTAYADFRAARGEALLDTPPWQQERAQHALFPICVAHASPSGLVTEDAFTRYLTEMLDGLRAALPVDGVLLHLHGAMEVERIGDGETAILRAVRDLIGPEPRIAVTLDLHANLAPEVVALSDIVTAYRTAPHRDVAATRERGARLLLDYLESGVRPVTRMVKLPLLVAGEAAVTEAEPAASLYARLPHYDTLPGVLTSSILIGCAWTDSPHTSVSTVVTAVDPATAEAAARELAAEVWEARNRFAIDSPSASIDDAIRMAYALPVRPVFISDSGDNPTAGAAGDVPVFLARLVELDVQQALVAGMPAPAAVAACFAAGVGGQVDVVLGGELDRVSGYPYPARVTVQRLVPEVDGIPPRALVSIGGVDIVLQSDRLPFTEMRHFHTMGVDPANYKAVVVKLGYLFPELRDYAPAHIMALSPGFGDQRLDRLPYRRLRRPIYPLDPDTQWPGAPGDALSQTGDDR
jgi:microcystin degradation protein MlrC